jgi:hypothetical protein
MTDPTKIYMSGDLYNDLRKKQKSIRQHGRNANLYMCGANKYGVLREAIHLSDDGQGCEFMPEIDSTVLAKTYMKLIKKKLTPAAFIHLIHDTEHSDADWGDAYGIAPKTHRDFPFITISTEFATCHIRNTKGDRLYPELTLVDKNFKPKSA